MTRGAIHKKVPRFRKIEGKKLIASKKAVPPIS
jgi:hypothetical protein